MSDPQARTGSYAELEKITFDGAQKRTDIGRMHF